MIAKWYYLDNGQQTGPVAGNRLKELADKGVIVPWTPVRRVFGRNRTPWTRAGAIKALFTQDVADLLGPPICDRCGTQLVDGACPKCTPPPPPVEAPQPTTDAAEEEPVATDTVEPAETTESTDESQQRYPHLRAQIAWLHSTAKIQFYLGVAVGMVILIAGAYLSIRERSIFEVLASALSAWAVYFMARWAHMFLKAHAEKLQVLIDTEEHTRQTELNTRRTIIEE